MPFARGQQPGLVGRLLAQRRQDFGCCIDERRQALRIERNAVAKVLQLLPARAEPFGTISALLAVGDDRFGRCHDQVADALAFLGSRKPEHADFWQVRAKRGKLRHQLWRNRPGGIVRTAIGMPLRDRIVQIGRSRSRADELDLRRVCRISGVGQERDISCVTVVGRRNQQVLERASDPHDQFAQARVDRADVAPRVRIDVYRVVRDVEHPWLGIVRVGGENRRMNEVQQPCWRSGVPVPPGVVCRARSGTEDALVESAPGQRTACNYDRCTGNLQYPAPVHFLFCTLTALNATGQFGDRHFLRFSFASFLFTFAT